MDRAPLAHSTPPNMCPALPCGSIDEGSLSLTQIEARVEMYTAEAEASLLAGQPDFVLDAIDNINTKVQEDAVCRLAVGSQKVASNGT